MNIKKFSLIISLCAFTLLWFSWAEWVNNVKHSINWDNVSVTWDIDSWDEQAEVYLWWEGSNNSFEKLWTIDSFNKRYNFSLTKDWEYIIRFIPNSGWQPVDYTFNTNNSNSSNNAWNGNNNNISDLDSYHPRPEDQWNIEDLSNNKVVTVPKTWPFEVWLISLILWIWIYLIYRFRRNKA